MCSFHCSNELLALAPIKYTITNPKSFGSSLSLLDFLMLLKICCRDCKSRQETVKDKLIYLKSTWQYTKANIFQKFSKNRWNSTSIKKGTLSRSTPFTFLYSDEARAIFVLCRSDKISLKEKLKKIYNVNNLDTKYL